MKVVTVPVTGFAQNCRIIICTESNQAALIDPGGDKEKLITELTKLNVKWLRYILLMGI